MNAGNRRRIPSGNAENKVQTSIRGLLTADAFFVGSEVFLSHNNMCRHIYN